MELMAALAVELVCEVGPQTILRPVARRLMAARGLKRVDFPFIAEHVWESRVGHCLTHMDAKASRAHARVRHIQSVCTAESEVLARVLALEHTAYITCSADRALVVEDAGEMAEGPLAKIWSTGSAEAMCKVACAVGAESARRQGQGEASCATNRHSIAGLPWVTRPATAASKPGAGQGRSLAGYADGSRTNLSLIHALMAKSEALHEAAKRPDGARALLAELEKLPGGGKLCSKRTLTYLEGTGLVAGVLDPYLRGGQGSRNALKFLAAVLGLDWSVVDEGAFMAALKVQLETAGSDGRRPLEAAVLECASVTPALRGLENMCAELASGLFTGGALETLLCDVIWRCWRPIKLGAQKPRLPRWDAETSGGEHLAAYAIFRTPTEGATVVNVDEFVRKWCTASKPGSAPQLPTSLFAVLPGRHEAAAAAQA
jgi:hypothetical protein